MALGPVLTLGLGNGTFSGNIPMLVLSGMATGDAAARASAEEGMAWYILAVACLSMLLGR